VRAVEAICKSTSFSWVTNGRFKGGWTTRHYGKPSEGVHAIQLELACRGYMDEPREVSAENWPTPYSEQRATDMRAALKQILQACLNFASK
jgi:formiminoglutamase